MLIGAGIAVLTALLFAVALVGWPLEALRDALKAAIRRLRRMQ